MSAEFFANSSPVFLSVIVYLRELIANVDITQLLSKPGDLLVTLINFFFKISTFKETSVKSY